jgi:hypothetical protein
MVTEMKVDDDFVKRYLKIFDKIVDKEYLKDSIIMVDSGGYQVQCGYVTREQIPKFIDMYYNDFILNNYNKYTYAFTLDLAPGFEHCPFKSWKDLEDINFSSYRNAASLDKKIREKLIDYEKYAKGNNAFLRLEPNASSSTNSVQSGRNLGNIIAMKYVDSERKLYMFVPNNYENKLYKWIWSGFIA